MKMILPLAVALAGLGACERRDGLFAERSIPVVAPAAQADTAPRFVGRWAAAADQCASPWVFEARGLQGAGVDCEFAKVDASSAGYSVAAMCRSSAGAQPGRLLVMLPDPDRPTTLTVSGGPFKDPVPLQRCAQ